MRNTSSIKLIALLVLLPLVGCSTRVRLEKSAIHLLDSLDRELARSADYERMFLDRMKGLREERDLLSEEDSICKGDFRIADEFLRFSVDSSLNYLNHAMGVAERSDNHDLQMEAHLRFAWVYAKSGTIPDALEVLQDCSRSDISEELLPLWYKIMYEIGTRYVADSFDKGVIEKYLVIKDIYRDSLLNFLPGDDFLSRQLKIEDALESNNDSLHVALIEDLVSSSPESLVTWGYAAYQMHRISSNENDKVVWLAKSSISAARHSMKNYAALTVLARKLFHLGYVGKAFNYISNYCIPDAMTFRGKLRLWRLALSSPEINQAYQAQDSKQDRWIILLLVIIAAMALALAIIVFLLWGRERALLLTRNNLRESNRVKDMYLSQFLSVISDNLEDKSHMRNKIIQSLRQGHSEELLEEYTSGHWRSDEEKEFYRMFDESFLALYPHFREQLNSLLKDDCQLSAGRGNLLTPEQRVYALIKLGISDTDKIASLLHYSKRTVYNCRSKVKRSALSAPSSMEKSIMDIHF
ncbi:MAG: hypothetical protein IJM41_08595 [Bacteroidales bacterium]|nr:hypothetical protein [Bacteroidales bacterium]